MTTPPDTTSRERRWRGLRLAAAALLAVVLAAGALYGTHSAFSSQAKSDSSFASDPHFTPKLDPADPPAIAGTPDEGQELTASEGTWTHATSFEYRWQACEGAAATPCEDMDGATARTFTVPHDYNGGTALAGKRIRVKVTGVNGDKKVTEQSAATADPVRTKPKNTAPPAVSGTAKEGQELTVDKGTWDADPAVPADGYTYRWERCATAGDCAPISGATSSSYTLKGADVEKTVRAVVTAENAVGPTSKASAETGSVLIAGTSLAGTASISGKTEVGETLTASTSWTRGGVTIDDATVAYQWQRCDAAGAGCTAIAGANSKTYKLVSNDGASTIRVKADASSVAGSMTTTGTVTSDQTAVVGVDPGASYEVVNLKSGKCVEVNAGVMDDNRAIDQWTCDGSGDHQRWAFAHVADGWFKVVSKKNAAKGWNVYGGGMAEETMVNLFPTATPPTDNELWKPLPNGDGTYRFVVKSSGKCLTVQGASVDNGARMLQYTCNGGTNQWFTLRAMNLQGDVTVTGTTDVGNVLTASVAWTRSGTPETGVATTWQWQRCDTAGANCANVGGATQPTYTLATADTGYTMKAVATGSKSSASGPLSGAAQSSATGIVGMAEGTWYNVIAQNSGKCMDVDGGVTNDGGVIQIYTCGPQPSEDWRFTPTDSGYVKIENRNALAKFVSVSGGEAAIGDSAGTEIRQWLGLKSQQWMPVALPATPGAVKLVARHSGRCLDVRLGSTADTTRLQQYTCNGTLPQIFTLVKQ